MFPSLINCGNIATCESKLNESILQSETTLDAKSKVIDDENMTFDDKMNGNTDISIEKLRRNAVVIRTAESLGGAKSKLKISPLQELF